MKEKEIVKYHNDLNELVFPDFKEQEHNIFFNIVSKMQEKNDEVITFSATEVSKFFGSAYPKEILAWMLKKMAHTMKTKGFIHISKIGQSTSTSYITMFPTFTIETDPNPNPNLRDDPMLKDVLKELRVRVNPDFIYLFNKIIGNFTAFELAEFISLSGKYTKTLYRLLKQFRQTGIAKFEWSEFLRIMDIPDNYRQTDIDQFILKPALKELTKERNLFDQQRIPFQNLTYEKIKGNGRGRGGNVIGIVFKFKPQKSNEFYLTKDEAIKHLRKENNELTKEAFESNLENSILKENNQALEYENEKLKAEALGVGLNAYCGLKYFSKDNEILCVINIEEIKNPSDKNRYKATIKNESKDKMFSIYIESIKHLLNIIKNNEYDLKIHNEALLERKNQKID